MHVGILLENVKPELGGGYTFMTDIAAAFFECAGETEHRFTILQPDAAEPYGRGGLPANVQIRQLRPEGLIGRGIMVMRHASRTFGILWRRQPRLARVARSLGIELIWFLGRYNDTIEVPYIATIWDVQHLTHPWFPEVSAAGRWEYRESFLSTHLRRATWVIVGTEVGRDQLAQHYGLPRDRVRILPHPTPAFALRDDSARSAPPVVASASGYLLYPAQFWPHKNHINLLHALRRLRDSRSDVPLLVLVGSDAGNRAYVEAKIAELGLQAAVRLLGFVSVEDLIALYRGARALVYPSFSGPENLPPLEAFALGCPVAASEFPGAREQLEDSVVYFDPARPESIAAAIARLLDEPELCRTLVERGLRRAARWTGKDYVRGVFAMIDDFAAQRRCWPPA